MAHFYRERPLRSQRTTNDNSFLPKDIAAESFSHETMTCIPSRRRSSRSSSSCSVERRARASVARAGHPNGHRCRQLTETNSIDPPCEAASAPTDRQEARTAVAQLEERSGTGRPASPPGPTSAALSASRMSSPKLAPTVAHTDRDQDSPLPRQYAPPVHRSSGIQQGAQPARRAADGAAAAAAIGRDHPAQLARVAGRRGMDRNHVPRPIAIDRAVNAITHARTNM